MLRLVIKEFLTYLKEKDELDFLLHELLIQMGYTIDSIPKNGNRQYGVDIYARKRNEICLFVIKQKNINRDVWDGNKNSVRQSMNDIRDVYLPLIIKNVNNKIINIIVATNGYLDEAVVPSWNGYIENNNEWRGYAINYSFWSIDTISQNILQYMLNEMLFNDEMQSLMRKALYFVEESDYASKFYEMIIDDHIERLTKSLCNKKNKESKKIISSLILSTQMIAYYSAEHDRYKISIMVTEYVLIKYWQFLLNNSLLGVDKWSMAVGDICVCYKKWNKLYYEKVWCICNDKDAFPEFETVIEQRVFLYETVGFLATFAFFELHNDWENERNDIIDGILHTIIKVFNNYPQIYYPPYDNHIGIITIIYRLLLDAGDIDNTKSLLRAQAYKVQGYYHLFHRFPAPSDTFKEAINIEYCTSEVKDYVASGFWGYILLWIAKLSCEDLYLKLIPFLVNEIGEVSKCIWIQNTQEEMCFYDRNAMSKSGTGVSLKIAENYNEFYKINDLDALLRRYREKSFSYEDFSFPSLEMIVCRYFGYIPRVI